MIDFNDPDANDWLAVKPVHCDREQGEPPAGRGDLRQRYAARCGRIEEPWRRKRDLDGAFNQLQTYKSQITSLFRTNAVLVISDGIAARIGSLTADRERFMPWRTVMGDGPAAKGMPELETMLKGVFDRRRFLDLVKDFPARKPSSR